MDLKIKDVAELLNVSETTIRRWLIDGKIPAYRLNHQYRFSRIEIENWMMSCKLQQSQEGFSPFSQEQESCEEVATLTEENPDAFQGVKEFLAQKGGMQQFSLYRAIHKGGVFSSIPGETKEEIIRATMKLIAPRLMLDPDVLSELLLDREKLMPTALNNGIAVPHPRDFLLQGSFDMVVVVFPEKPIVYGALDGKPVHTLFFLFSSGDKRHLHLLAKLAHLSSNDEAIAMLLSHPEKEQFLEYIRSWEAGIRHQTD